MGCRGDDHANASEGVGGARARQAVSIEEASPMLGALSRPERLAHEMKPREGARVGFAARHEGNVLALHAEVAQKLSHAGLRMLGMISEQHPAFVVQGEV